jgi:transcriptional regulator with XRE-family HTH domain
MGILRVESGREIAAARKANGLTQQELAQRAAVSLSLLRKIEQGSRSLSPEVSAALRTVLQDRTEDASAPDRITSALADVRGITDVYDIVPEIPRAPIPLQELRTLTSSATRLRLASRYTQLASLLPALIADLTAAALTSSGGHEQQQAFGLLALAYRSADAIADKYGHHDLSARATELIRWSAARADDRLLEQMSAYVRAELFFNGTQPRAGLRLLDNATGSFPAAAQIPQMAAHGALCMRSAVLAARAGLHSEASDRIAEAQAAARHVPDDIYQGTAFGPSSVRVHELALAVEADDMSRAVTLASAWVPPRALPAERRSHFYIEAARAYCWTGDREQAVTQIWHARRIAPQHTQQNPAVNETVRALIRASRKPLPDLMRIANWIGVA